MSRAYRLRLPGPTTVPEQVRQAVALSVLNHRGPEFTAIAKEVQSRLQRLIGTENSVLLFCSSGTGVMEASLANTVMPGERVLLVSNGQFAERFGAIGEALGAHVDALQVEWGESADTAKLANKLAQYDYRALVVVHNESSTGAVADLKAIGGLVRNTSTLLIVDSVSGLGGIDMQQDSWGVDILVSASQKALMCPPGIGIASVSEKAWRVIDDDSARARFYWDFRKARDSADSGQSAFTSSVSLVAGLREALRMIDDESLPRVLDRHARLSGALQAGGTALGFSVFTRAPIRSNTVTVLQLPKARDGAVVVRHLYERYGTVIAGARNKLQGKVIRFGTMGHIDESDILTDLMHLERTIYDLGWPLQAGAGISAAQEYLLAH